MAYGFLSVVTIAILVWKVIPAATVDAAASVFTVASSGMVYVRLSIVANLLSLYLHSPSRLSEWGKVR